MNITTESNDSGQNLRHPENAPGPWYVNDECIVCDACFEYAPDHFRLSADAERSIVFKQPETAAEIETAGEALDLCPVGAIINDTH